MHTRLRPFARVLPLAFLLTASLPAQAQTFGDLVFAVTAGIGDRDRVCRNDGRGFFTCEFVSNDPDRSEGVAAADLDGDGDDDLAFANSGTAGTAGAPNQICLNGGAGFTCLPVSADANNSLGVAAADLDGDGDRDLVFANTGPSGTGGATNDVCLNDGAGRFTCRVASADADRSVDVAVADFDGDGDLDLAFVNTGDNGAGAADRVCLNDGAATFTCAAVAAEPTAGTDVAAADLDGDGDQDLAFATFFGTNRVCLNNGAGAFTCANASSDPGDSQGVVAADLDGDGDVDLAFANPISNNSNRTSTVCLNAGNATFTCAPLSPDRNDSRAIAATDIDADGDVDLVVANGRFFSTAPNRVCFNDGAGAFSCAPLPSGGDNRGVVAGNFGGRPVAAEETTPALPALDLRIDGNPVRGIASVTLTLTEARSASVVVFDALGREVARLHDGPLSAGTHEATLDTRRLSPGIYVIRLTAGAEVATQRLTVVR